MIGIYDVIFPDVTTHKVKKNNHNIYKQKLMQLYNVYGSIEELWVNIFYFSLLSLQQSKHTNALHQLIFQANKGFSAHRTNLMQIRYIQYGKINHPYLHFKIENAIYRNLFIYWEICFNISPNTLFYRLIYSLSSELHGIRFYLPELPSANFNKRFR